MEVCGSGHQALVSDYRLILVDHTLQKERPRRPQNLNVNTGKSQTLNPRSPRHTLKA